MTATASSSARASHNGKTVHMTIVGPHRTESDTIYATTPDELREKEEEIISDKRDGIKVENRRIAVNAMFDMWCT